jgi:cytochrome bd-type quinol oxidase subunit 1
VEAIFISIYFYGWDRLSPVAHWLCSFPYEIMHMVLAAFVGIGFGVATVYAIVLLRGKRDGYHRKALLLGLIVGLVSIPLQMFAGDAIARSLEMQQLIKLASMEAVYTTSTQVPLHLMGIPDVPQEGWFTQGLVIPDGLSLLVGHYRVRVDGFPGGHLWLDGDRDRAATLGHLQLSAGGRLRADGRKPLRSDGAVGGRSVGLP